MASKVLSETLYGKCFSGPWWEPRKRWCTSLKCHPTAAAPPGKIARVKITCTNDPSCGTNSRNVSNAQIYKNLLSFTLNDELTPFFWTRPRLRRVMPGSSPRSRKATTLLEAYFVYPNGTALDSAAVGRILNSQSVYEEYGVILQQYGLTGIVRTGGKKMCAFVYVLRVCYKVQREPDRGFVCSLLMVLADGKHGEGKRRQHSVVHHGGTRGRARDRPDRHHDVDGVH